MMTFWLCFVPLFVAVDAIGVLPMFIGLIQDIDQRKVRRLIYQSTITAIVVALIFLLAGNAVLGLLGITVADFMIAGGILLFVISVSDLIRSEKTQRKVDPESLGAVPLGVPLLAGPAVFTTSMLLMNEHGFIPASTAVVLNMLIAGTLFLFSDFFHSLLGRTGAKILSKIANLFMAAIAVMMIRKGVMFFAAG